MSLKAIHIVFITASLLLTVGFGFWSLNNYSTASGTRQDLAFAIGSFVLAIAMIVYGRYFLKKLKNVEFL